jgi:HAD superfamily phosphatase
MRGPIAIAIFDIDGVVRDVSGSYRRAIADTVEAFTQGRYRPTPEAIDQLKGEGIWNNDWQASQELVYRHFEAQNQSRDQIALDYETLVDFFQQRYRGVGDDATQWTGYITQEPLLMSAAYLAELGGNGIPWAFFSGATRGSANYVLQTRLGLQQPPLVAMEDAPGKPDPTGLMMAVEQVERLRQTTLLPVIYAGDTVADMQTIIQARARYPDRQWLAVGVLPPHVQTTPDYQTAYAQKLTAAGAATIVSHIEALSAPYIQSLLG